MDESNKLSFDISEPTEEEIKQTIQKIQDQYDIALPNDDAITYTKLYEELKQWFFIEKNLQSPDSIAEEVAEKMQGIIEENHGLEVSEDEAKNIVDESLDEVIAREKERIGKELKTIIDKYKK